MSDFSSSTFPMDLEQKLEADKVLIEDKVRTMRDAICKELERIEKEIEHILDSNNDAADGRSLPESREKRNFYTKMRALECDRLQQVRKTKLMVECLLSNPDVKMTRQPSYSGP